LLIISSDVNLPVNYVCGKKTVFTGKIRQFKQILVVEKYS